MNDKDVCRTAPATPGLVNIQSGGFINLILTSQLMEICHRIDFLKNIMSASFLNNGWVPRIHSTTGVNFLRNIGIDQNNRISWTRNKQEKKQKDVT